MIKLPFQSFINFVLGEHLKMSVAPLVVAGGVTAAGTLAGGLIKARQAKKKRKQEAELKAADITRQTGSEQSKAIGGIIQNLRAALIR